MLDCWLWREFDGHDMVAPSGEGATLYETALDGFNGVGLEQPVDYINAHGTSTPVGDVKELGYSGCVGPVATYVITSTNSSGIHLAQQEFRKPSIHFDDAIILMEHLRISSHLISDWGYSCAKPEWITKPLISLFQTALASGAKLHWLWPEQD